MSKTQKKIKNLQDETKRREQVLKEKEVGKKIEDIEKARISKDVISIKGRISLQTTQFRGSARVLREELKPSDKANDKVKKAFLVQIKLYNSIREDICTTLEKKEKNFRIKFERIFPKLSFPSDTCHDIAGSYLSASEQLMHINIFLDRYVK